MLILGISCFYHDAAACLLRDGRIIAACQEERLTRVKHDWRFPEASIRYCLQEAGAGMDDVGCVAFYEKPLLKFERVLETFLAVAPRGLPAFLDVMPSWLRQKLWLPHILKQRLGYGGRIEYYPHHFAHAASAYFPSSFPEAAVLTIDGVGEWATASYGTGRGSRITLTHEMRFPHSLGLLYSAVTSYLGFKVNNDEYKVMGMAPYGKPVHAEAMLREMLSLKQDGSIGLNLAYFSFQYGRRMFDARRFETLFGVPPRKPDTGLEPRHFDIAASLQQVTETVVLAMARHVRRETGLSRLCLAGGVALNSVANGRLLREGVFDDIFVQPASGDAGGALGAATAACHQEEGRGVRQEIGDLAFGPSFGADEVLRALRQCGVRSEELPEEALYPTAARLLEQGRVVGWFRGRMEFGPRALGNRSILADPRRPEMKDLINSRIKFREPFRPFAPAVAAEDAERYFEMERPSPFMLFTVPVRSDRIPAVTHVDGSARVQTVSSGQNPSFHALLKAFEKVSGLPILLNTSLNVRGEPIACSPEDALHCLTSSGLDFLVLENRLCYK